MSPEPFDLHAPYGDDDEDYLISKGSRTFVVDTLDGPVEIMGGYLAFTMILIKPVIARKIPMRERYLLTQGDLTSDMQVKIHNAILFDAMKAGIDPHEIARELDSTITELQTMIHWKLGEYAISISMEKIALTLEVPELREACEINIEPKRRFGVKVMESYYEERFKHLLKVYKDPTIKGNHLGLLLRLGAIRAAQFPQLMAARGFCTDTDEALVERPIESGYLQGMYTIMDVATDSLQAMLAKYNNKYGMKRAQYNNRKQQLESSVIKRIYPGDCGSTKYTPFHINGKIKGIKDLMLGTNFWTCDGVMETIDHDNFGELVDTVVNIRTPGACRHTDGTCHACGGMLSRLLPERCVPGLISATISNGPVTQMVLGTKHNAVTSTMLYATPSALRDYMWDDANKMYLDPKIPMEELWIGVPENDVLKFSDLRHVDANSLYGQWFSTITRLQIGFDNDGKPDPVTFQVPMISDTATPPFFTADFLRHVKANPDKVIHVGSMVWINMGGFDVVSPIMQTIALNDSTKRYVKRYEEYTAKHIAELVSLPSALQQMCDLVWEKTYPHIFHLGILVKSTMITSDYDYYPPVVEDVNNVRFGKLQSCIPRRSYGEQIGFQQFPEWIRMPTTFITPRKNGVFDTFLGFND